MNLVLHQHPFASYCQKALIALYELELPFTSHQVDGLEGREALARLWPMASIPVLRDEDADLTLPESTTVAEYLDGLAGGGRLIPADRAGALQARLWDRLADGHLSTPMQTIVGDRLRPDDAKDPYGVEQARAGLDRFYGVLDDRLASCRGRAARRSRSRTARRPRRSSTCARSTAGTRPGTRTSRATTAT